MSHIDTEKALEWLDHIREGVANQNAEAERVTLEAMKVPYRCHYCDGTGRREEIQSLRSQLAEARMVSGQDVENLKRAIFQAFTPSGENYHDYDDVTLHAEYPDLDDDFERAAKAAIRASGLKIEGSEGKNG